MGSRAVDLEKHRLALLAAKGDVVSGRAAASWALFAYERSNELKLLDSGAGAPDELAKRFQSSSVMYGLCRLPGTTPGQQHVILINWVGEKVSEQRRQACAGHLPAIRAFFKEAQLVVKASQAKEVTQDGLKGMLSSVAPAGAAAPTKAPLGDSQDLVGTNYQKTNPVLEILHTKRSSFWAQAEREEEERRREERRRAQEERRRWERQRMEEERRQAAERERRIQEKEQLIQEQRKQQAQREAEERLQEEAARRGAAALASQHTASPWDLLRPRERSGSASGTQGLPSSPGGQPGLPRRPFLRYQRSLTESAYIFRCPDPPPGPSPGVFLPSVSPGSPPAAPLPSPRGSKLPPPISPKPGPGAPSSLLGAGPLPTGAETPPPYAPPVPQTAPRASPLPAASPLAEGGIHVAGVGDLAPLLPAVPGPPCAPLPPSPSCSPGPPRAGTPPLCTPPAAKSPPTTPPLPHHACLDSSPQAGPVTPTDGPQDTASLPSLPPGGASPLTALPEEPVSPLALSGPSPTCSLGQRGSAPGGEGEGGPPQISPVASAPPDTPPPPEEKEAPADGSPAPAPDPSWPESAPYSSHNGVAAVEGRWRPQGQGLSSGGQGGSPTEAQITEAALQDPGTGDVALGPGKASQEEGRDHTGDASVHTAAPAAEN